MAARAGCLGLQKGNRSVNPDFRDILSAFIAPNRRDDRSGAVTSRSHPKQTRRRKAERSGRSRLARREQSARASRELISAPSADDGDRSAEQSEPVPLSNDHARRDRHHAQAISDRAGHEPGFGVGFGRRPRRPQQRAASAGIRHPVQRQGLHRLARAGDDGPAQVRGARAPTKRPSSSPKARRT